MAVCINGLPVLSPLVRPHELLSVQVNKLRIANMHWLDYAEACLSKDGQVRQELQLDGVHLSPAIVDELEKAIAKASI